MSFVSTDLNLYNLKIYEEKGILVKRQLSLLFEMVETSLIRMTFYSSYSRVKWVMCSYKTFICSLLLLLLVVVVAVYVSHVFCLASLQPHSTPCTPTTEPIHPCSAGLTSVSLTLTFEVQNECGISVAFFIYAGDYTKKNPVWSTQLRFTPCFSLITGLHLRV